MPKFNSQIINGRFLADKIFHEIRQEIVKKKLTPSLAVILVGDSKASKVYVKLKQKACLKCGIEFYLYELPKDALEKQVLECLDFLNQDKEINGIIVQLPLPKHLDEDKIIKALDPRKDADGFHPENIKLLKNGRPYIIPGLCEGIIKLIRATREDISDKNVLIVSNSQIFAEPFNHLFVKGRRVKTCEWVSPQDKNFSEKTKEADVIIIAIGKPKFLKANMIKKEVIIIDVGCNFIKNIGSRLKRAVWGDVDFTSCGKKAKWISPVPGGVGPVTVAMLLANTVKLYKQQHKIISS